MLKFFRISGISFNSPTLKLTAECRAELPPIKLRFESFRAPPVYGTSRVDRTAFARHKAGSEMGGAGFRQSGQLPLQRPPAFAASQLRLTHYRSAAANSFAPGLLISWSMRASVAAINFPTTLLRWATGLSA